MHRATPLNTSFRSYSSGGARSIVDKVDDTTLMQEMSGNFMKGETREKVEAPQNFGFTSVVLPAKKGKDGQIEESAEAFIQFMGGNRSFPVCSIMDDRRFRPMGLKPGENAQYDDAGQMTLLRRGFLAILSLDSEDENGKKVERFVSLRHVEKKKQERQKSYAESSASAGTQLTVEQYEENTAALKKKHEDFKHEGESVNTEVRCTKSRIEFRAGDNVVGYYDVGADTWFLKGKIVQMEATQRVETIGKTYLGLDTKGEIAPKVVTEDGPAKQTYAKAG